MSAPLLALTLLFASPQEAAEDAQQRFLYLLPEGFSGWVCIDFGVAGAPPLPREEDQLVIRARPGEVLRTSDKSSLPFFGEARIEVQGERYPLPDGVYERKLSSRSNSNEPVARHCAFFGTEDEADAAGEAPGLESPEVARRVSREERKALVALYESTNGAQWKHRVGWLGAPGTECSWHGVRCDLRIGQKTVVADLELNDNNLVGPVPEALGELGQLETLWLWGNRLTGRLPEATQRRWLEGSLDLASDASLLTDVSEVELESDWTGLLCGHRRILLRADGSVHAYATLCRKATPDDRETFCEVKRGRVQTTEFGRLGLFLERGGFFSLREEYSRSVTHGRELTTRATRNGVTHQVRTYATDGPMGLWSIQRAVDGVAAAAEWESVAEEPRCPDREHAP